jgi:cyanophycinase-like exopeptidase
MKGYLILNGGEAFSPKTKDTDIAWLQLIRRGSQRPRVIVIPAAATQKADKTAEQVVSYFKHLGTYPEYTRIISQETANGHIETEILDKVEALVLFDGSPADLVERLADTKTDAALRRALDRKAAVMAVGASAMALGGVYWMGDIWERGLGLAPHLAILPRHEVAQMRLTPARLMETLPAGITIIGIDTLTTLTWHPDDTYSVAGRGEVMVYRSVEKQDVYRAGKQFKLKSE